MRHDLFIAGYGGQGVLLAGNLLSYAAIHEGKNVSFFPAYGVEKRGGSAMCTIVFADGDTGSPVVGHPSVSILLNQLSFDKYAAKVKQGGICIVNSSLVECDAVSVPGVKLIMVPMNQIALDLGDVRMVNMQNRCSGPGVAGGGFEKGIARAQPQVDSGQYQGY